MANELNIPLDPVDDVGLTIIGRVRQYGGTQQGSDVSMTESASGFYSGDFALGAVPDGNYIVQFIDNSSGNMVGSGELSVKDGVEVNLATLNNFNPVSDTVANVTNVASNSDMRGTDSANTVAPDNAGITANGNAITGLNNFNPALDTVVNVTNVATNNDKSGYSISGTKTTLDALNDPSTQNIVDGVWDEPLTGSTHNDPTSAGRRLRQSSAWLSAEGKAVGTPTNTSVQTDLTQTQSSFYVDQTMVFTSGSLAGEARIVTAYDGTTKTLTFDEPWVLAPSASDEFAIFSDHIHPISQVASGVDTELTSNHGSGSWQSASGVMDSNVISVNGSSVTGTGDFKADVSNLDVPVSSRNSIAPDNAGIAQNGIDINGLNDISLAEIEGSTILAKESTVATKSSQSSIDIVDSNIDSILVNTGTDIPAQITGLNDLSATDVKSQTDQALIDYDVDTKTNIKPSIPI